MKKIYLLSCLFLALAVAALGQSQRFVLFEEFTSASCYWCGVYNPAFNALLNTNTNKCTSIKYQSNFGYDPMYLQNKVDVNTRTSYYSVPGYPDAIMDGNAFHDSPASVTQAIINARYAVPSPFELSINQRLSIGGDSIYITMLGKATAAVSGALFAHCAVIEKHIHFNTAPGTNGEKDFYNVMKKMLPTASGTALPTTIQAGEYFILKLAWKLANVYSNDELSVVGFIQNNTTKEILQSANTSVTPITGIFQNDLTLMSPGNLLTSYCEPSIAPSFVIQNNGNTPLTAATIKYRVNSEPEAVYQWSGNLGFLEETRIFLPALEFTVNPSNVLKIYGVSTNGGADEYPGNDTTRYGFNASPVVSLQAIVFIKTDQNPQEVTWSIKDISGNQIATGGPYTEASHSYSIPVDLALGTCYEFNILDSGGDGLCCDHGMGFYKVYSGSTNISVGNAFGSSATNQFYAFSEVGVATPDPASFSVYPNPAWNQTTIALTTAVTEQVTIQVYNMQGARVIDVPTKEYASGQHQIKLDCSNLSAGVYQIRLTAGNKAFNQKLTINR